MSCRPLVSVLALAALVAWPAGAQTATVVTKTVAATKAGSWTPPRTPDGQPDLQGIWNNGTVTPMERPAELAGRNRERSAEDAAVYGDRGRGIYDVPARDIKDIRGLSPF